MLIGYSEVPPVNDHPFSLRILANKKISVVELPTLQRHNTEVICEGGPRTMENGKINIDWSLNQKIILTIEQAT